MNNIEKGKIGEKISRDYLIKNGYTILETNYKNKIGEIDIIALSNDIVVFVEVKSRTNTKYGYAFEAVNISKQRKIINTSFIYIKNNKMDNFQLRYDIIEVYLTNNLSINHIENAFCL
jgi:putative endonuclease